MNLLASARGERASDDAHSHHERSPLLFESLGASANRFSQQPMSRRPKRSEAPRRGRRDCPVLPDVFALGAAPRFASASAASGFAIIGVVQTHFVSAIKFVIHARLINTQSM
jgi:hypothetical protein